MNAYDIFGQWYSQVSFDERYYIGYSLEDMLFTCLFNYVDCRNRFVSKDQTENVCILNRTAHTAGI